jgi:GH35 family endo-1,4-beta-xylanase
MQYVILAAFWIFPLNALSQDVRQTEARMMKQAEQNIEKYRKSDVTVQFKTRDGRLIKDARVEIRQKTHDFLFGCIIFDLIRNENSYREDLFKERFKKIFNLAVFPFYWPGYESRQGFSRWAGMLPVIDWCRANGITTKGHPLVWATHSGAPRWLSEYTEEETEELLKTRVMNITAGFRGQIELWDVVNEPVYNMLDQLINQTWKTNTSVQTDLQGTISFRGFFGEYEIALKAPSGKIRLFPVHVRKDEENRWVFVPEGYDN